MARPQQRAPRNRRTLSENAPRRVPSIAWSLGSFSINTATIVLENVAGTIVLAGVPQIRNLRSGSMPVAATLAGNSIFLNFPSNEQLGPDFELATQDNALRTNLGAFLALGTQSSDLAEPVAVTFRANTESASPGFYIWSTAGSESANLQPAAPENSLCQVAFTTTLPGATLTVRNEAGADLLAMSHESTASFRFQEGTWTLLG